MLAASCKLIVHMNMPKQQISVSQIVPAVPPFERPKTPVTSENSQVSCSRRSVYQLLLESIIASLRLE